MNEETKNTYLKNKRLQDLDTKTVEWIQNEYLQYCQRQAHSKATINNHLQSLYKIAKLTDIDITNIQKEEVEELTKKITADIQSSKLRLKNDGKDNSKRRKRQQFTVWKNIVKLNGHQIQTEFTPKKSRNVNRQADTKPEDLPTPQQVQDFVQAIGKHSGDKNKTRNRALILLMWDKGPRIGELLNIQIKDCEIQNERLKIFIEGNKKYTKDRKVEVFQGRLTLKEFIKDHPGTSEDYLFSDLTHEKLDRPVSKQNIREKIRQVAQKQSFDFKVKGEPTHIFRKGMTTSHVVNGWATWEEIAEIQGKSVSGTKPTYLKMALSDVDDSVADKMGVRNKEKVSEDGNGHRMLGQPLLPKRCKSCDGLNRCYQSVCRFCGGNVETIERSQVEESVDKVESQAEQFMRFMNQNPELLEEAIEKYEQEEN